VRKGEELKAPYYTSTTALCDDYVITYNIIPNIGNSFFVVAIYIQILLD
jgi:hypothetical protein